MFLCVNKTTLQTHLATWNTIYLCTMKLNSNYFHFHQTDKMYRDLPAKWPETEHSETPSRQWLDRYDTSTYEMSIIMLGSLFSAGLSSIWKWYPVPTAGGLMTANGACLSPVISCYGFPSAFFFLNISCSEDYMRPERKFPNVCPLLHSATGPLNSFLFHFVNSNGDIKELAWCYYSFICPYNSTQMNGVQLKQ